MLRVLVALVALIAASRAMADPAEDAAKAAGKAVVNIADSGLWGSAAMLGLALLVTAIVFLWRDRGRTATEIKDRDKSFKDDIAARDAVIQALQDKRAEENKFWADRVATVSANASATSAKLSETIDGAIRKSDAILRAVESLPPAVEQMVKMLDRNASKIDEGMGLLQKVAARDR